MAAAVPTKVFVGNLSFKTRDADLARAFEAVGKVSSANIITRGPRSLGYGFVEFASNDDAEKAISKLNKTELDGRQINVEIAKPRDQTAAAEASPAAGARPRRRRQPRTPSADGSTADAAPTAATTTAAAGGSPTAATKPRRTRKPRSPSTAGATTGASATSTAAPTAAQSSPTTDAAAQDGRRPVRRGRGRRFGGGRFGNRFGAGRPKIEEPRVASTTTLFVANLPYQVDNAGLADIFKEFNPAKAYVVQTHSGRSRGFGFVEFGNETDQQNALKNIDKKVVHERALSVKVSQVRDQNTDGASPDAGPAN